MIRNTLTILLSFLLLVASASAQDDSFSEQKWQKLTEGIDYSEKERELPDRKSVEESDNFQDSGDREYRDPNVGGSIFSGMGMVILVIAGVVVLALIVFIIANMKSNPALERQNVEIKEIENIEERIHEVNLDDLFGRFVAGGEYNLALRMSFLAIIKLLSEQKLIQWAKQKTNWEYHGEVADFDLRTGFGSMISIYERMWYGEQVISEPEFHYIEAEFNRFKARLDGEE